LVPHFFIGAFQRHREVPQRARSELYEVREAPTGGSIVHSWDNREVID
jgi:hypothetical protein